MLAYATSFIYWLISKDALLRKPASGPPALFFVGAHHMPPPDNLPEHFVTRMKGLSLIENGVDQFQWPKEPFAASKVPIYKVTESIAL